MEEVKLEKVAKMFGVDEDLLYAAMGRRLISHTRDGEGQRIKLTKKSRAVIKALAASPQNRQFKIRELKHRLKLQERIIRAKDETIAAKEDELNNIKEVYNNLLHLYQETKAIAAKKAQALEAPEEIPEGYILMSPGLFSTRMQDLGFSLERIKETIVEGVVDGTMDFAREGLVLEEDFFSRFKKSKSKAAKGK